MSEENPVAVRPAYPPLLRSIRFGPTAIVPGREDDRSSTDVWVLSPGHPVGRHLPSRASARISSKLRGSIARPAFSVMFKELLNGRDEVSHLDRLTLIRIEPSVRY